MSQTCKKKNQRCSSVASDRSHFSDTAKSRLSGRGSWPPGALLANNIFPHLVGSKSCTVHANLHNDGLIIEALSGAAAGGRSAWSRSRLMNDNNSGDRLTLMSYCAEFDMVSGTQSIEAESGVLITRGRADTRWYEVKAE